MTIALACDMFTPMYGVAYHKGGAVMVRARDNASIFFQPGDDANRLRADVFRVCTMNIHVSMRASFFNGFCAEYDDVMKADKYVTYVNGVIMIHNQAQPR